MTKIFFFVLLLIGCNASKTIPKKNPDTLIMYEFINFTGKYYQTMEIPKIIIQDSGYTFLRVPAILTYENNEKKPDTSYSYYLFHKNYEYGFYKSHFPEDSNKIINKDSFFLAQFYSNLEKINTHSKDDYSFLKSYKEGGLTVNKYYLKKEMDSSYSDTSLFYFDDKLKGIEFSLDRNLDSIYQSKFVKMRSLYYNKIKGSPLFGTVYREISISFKPGNYHTQTELDSLIATFEQFNSAKRAGKGP